MQQSSKWLAAIQIAPDEGIVALVIRDYVGTIEADVIDLLPKACRTALRETPIDVQGAAVTFLREELGFKGQQPAWNLLREASQILAAASVRISSLRAAPPIAAR